MPGLRLQNLHPIFQVSSDTQIYLFVESSGAQDRRIEEIRPIGGPNDEDLVARGDVHLHEEFCHDSVHHLIRITAISSFRYEGIQLIHENNAWLRSYGSLKDLPDVLLALAHIHVEQLWALDADKTHLALLCNAFP